MQLSNLDLNLLVVLDALLTEGSVSGAARRIGRSPSAVSHSLARLRVQLDDPVLVRAGRSMVRSPRAEVLRPEVAEALAAVARVLGPPPVLEPGRLERAFTVDTTDHVSLVLLPDVHRALTETAPGVDLFLRPIRPDATEDLRHGSSDLAIGVFGDLPPDIERQDLFDDRLVVACRADHADIPDQLDLDRYCALPHLLVAPRGTPRGGVDRALARIGRTRRVARTTPSFLAAAFLVEQSDLLLTISARVARFLTGRVALRILPAPLTLAPYTLEQIWHRRQSADPAHTWLRRRIATAAGSTPDILTRTVS